MPFVKIELVNAVLRRRSCVVHQDIDQSTEFFRSLLRGVGNRFRHGSISRYGKHALASCSCNIIGGAPQRILGTRHHRDVAALAGEFFRDGAANAKARARHKRPPAFDEKIHLNSP